MVCRALYVNSPSRVSTTLTNNDKYRQALKQKNPVVYRVTNPVNNPDNDLRSLALDLAFHAFGREDFEHELQSETNYRLELEASK